MRQRSFILVAVFVFLLIAGAVGLYAYDSSREDLIAEGVTVAGLDVGGMRAGRAREVVRHEVQAPLEQPIVINGGKSRFTLSAKDAGSRADVGGMVDEAIEASREGNVLTRSWRDLTGGEEDARVSARISYSQGAVERLVARVKKGLNRPAQDARVEFPSLARVQEKDGVEVKAGTLQKRVEQALAVPGVERQLKAPTETVKPAVTREQLSEKYPLLLVADRNAFRLKFYRQLRLAKTYTVAVGAVGFDTPAGLYRINNKAVNPAWTVPEKDWAGSLAGKVIPGGRADNPLKARWLGIYDGVGIHGTDQTASLGTRASKGCIRMAIPEVIELYKQVPVGASIYIA